MIVELRVPIRMYTPYGKGYAVLYQCAGAEADQEWTVIHDDGVIINFPNHAVRAGSNVTLDRRSKPPKRTVRLTG